MLSIELVSLKLPTPGGQPQEVAIVTKPLSSKSQGTAPARLRKQRQGQDWELRSEPSPEVDVAQESGQPVAGSSALEPAR